MAEEVKKEANKREGFLAIRNDLKEAFIYREYATRYNKLGSDFKEKAIKLYRDDPHVYALVCGQVACIMDIINKHIID